MAKQDVKTKIKKLRELVKKQRDLKEKNKKTGKLVEETNQFFAGLDERRKQRAEEIEKIFEEFDQAVIDFLPEE